MADPAPQAIARDPDALAEGVDLCRLHAAAEDPDDWIGLLDETERKRSALFQQNRDRRNFILGRGLLRVMLARAAKRPARHFTFDRQPGGKPILIDVPDLAFNVSHSGDMIVAAVARARALGVDVQEHRPGLDLRALAKRVFTAGEQAVIAGSAQGDRTAAFFRHWVFKEAFLKGLGSGLLIDPRGFEITVDGGTARVQRMNDPTPDRNPRWRLREVAILDGYSAALAIQP